MTTIYFVRHGDYENPKEIVPARRPGFPLSEKGRKQIENLSPLFRDKKISAIYASPILRTKQTAEILGKALHIKPKIGQFLIEVFIPFAGWKKEKFFNEVKKTGSVYKLPFHIQHGGESIDDLYRRMKKFVQKVLKSHKGENIILVSHGDPIMVFFLKETKSKLDIYKVLAREIFPEYEKYFIPMAGLIEMKFDKGLNVSAKKWF